MKVIFELPFKSSLNPKLTQFEWLKNSSNWLFILEDGKKIRTISVNSSPPREIQFANLAEKRVCTCFSWNYDGSQLALVIDERQIYLWDVKSNKFNNFKPINHEKENNGSGANPRRGRPSTISLIGWSSVSNRLAICLSEGQLILTDFTDTSNIHEKFIDNSSGVLRRVAKLEPCPDLDMFACITIISEVLVMTFDGIAKFYVQAENLSIIKIRFSPLKDIVKINDMAEATTHYVNYQRSKQPYNHNSNRNLHNLTNALMHRQKDENGKHSPISFVWMSYQSRDGVLLFKRIVFDFESPETSSEADLCFDRFEPNYKISHGDEVEQSHMESQSAHLVDHFWINLTHLVCCDSSGSIKLLEIKRNSQMGFYAPTVHLLLNIRNESSTSPRQSPTGQAWPPFKSFDFRFNAKKSKLDILSIAGISSSEIFYYELVVTKRDNDDFINEPHLRSDYSLERVDDLDLGLNLKKFQLNLEQVAWSFDCSMLAVQLTGGYTLAYRTHLENYLHATCGSKTAHLSTPAEVTILDFQMTQSQDSNSFRGSSSASSNNSQTNPTSSKALVVNIQMKPSIMAIGPFHLAVGLNNRVLLYQICSSSSSFLNDATLINQVNYSSIVSKIELSSLFMATLFLDGRLKLSSIHNNNINNLDTDDRERTFPDPGQRFERITSFSLTESIFLYCTENTLRLHMFCLREWSLMQICDHSRITQAPIIRLRANHQGNKFICSINERTKFQENSKIFLYDLNTNKLVEIRYQSNKISQNQPKNLFRRILETQVKSTNLLGLSDNLRCLHTAPFNHITDEIWDTDGRSLILIEERRLHHISVLEHTLENPTSSVTTEHIVSLTKPQNNLPVYMTQGIVSFQTKLGRMINAVLLTHDDDLRLTKLESQIVDIQSSLNEQSKYIGQANENVDIDESECDKGNGRLKFLYSKAKFEVIRLKLSYVLTVLPIYSLNRCKCIIEHLTTDEQLNLVEPSKALNIGAVDCDPEKSYNPLLWRVLAAWSIYTMNFKFALSIYRRCNMMSHARLLNQLIRNQDSIELLRDKLLTELLELNE